MAKRIKSPQELALLRDWVKSETDLRRGLKELQVTVHMGTCGIAAGARDILSLLAAELTQNDMETVTLTQSGCFGMCAQEPMITVKDKAGKEFRYGRLDKNKIRRIVREHLGNGTPVIELLITT